MTKAELKTDTIPVACFAPPLTDEGIAGYELLANALPDSHGDVRHAMRECLAAVKLWWGLPESKGTADDAKLKIVHRGSEVRVDLKSLTPDLVEKLWDAVPWPYEIDAIQKLFDKIDPAEKELRDACFHLLWHAQELCLDREPLTQDKLPV